MEQEYENFERYARELKKLRKGPARAALARDELAQALQFHGGEKAVLRRLRKRAQFLKNDPENAWHVLDHQAGIADAASKLLEFHGERTIKPIVNSASRIRRISRGVVDKDDLMQEGKNTLLNAAGSFDYTRGDSFNAYAATAVRHTMGGMIVNARRRLTRSIAAQKDLAYLALANQMRVASGLERLAEDSGAREKVFAHIRKCVEGLTPRQQAVIRAVYGLGERQRKQSELAAEWKTTRQNVSETHYTAMNNLRRKIDWDLLSERD